MSVSRKSVSEKKGKKGVKESGKVRPRAGSAALGAPKAPRLGAPALSAEGSVKRVRKKVLKISKREWKARRAAIITNPAGDLVVVRNRIKAS